MLGRIFVGVDKKRNEEFIFFSNTFLDFWDFCFKNVFKIFFLGV